MRFRAFSAVALSAFLLSGTSLTAAPVSKVNAKNKFKVQNPNRVNVQGKNMAHNNGHLHHLLKAEQDIRAAEVAIKSQNIRQAEKDIANAIRQIQDAMQHHHKHHIGQTTRTGLGGVAHRTHHHHHHSLLQQAERDLRAAERQLKNGGNVGKEFRELHAAQKAIQNAIASHKRIF